MTFTFICAVGLLLCVVDIAVLVSWMNKNLKKDHLFVDLGMLPAMLPALAGFALFPLLNVFVGVAGAVILANNRPTWNEAFRG